MLGLDKDLYSRTTIYIPVLDNIRKTKQQKTKEHMKYSYMYVYTRMIFAAVLSPAIKIFHRHLGPNLLIFAVKVSP
jgi:hypothetical protein